MTTNFPIGYINTIIALVGIALSKHTPSTKIFLTLILRECSKRNITRNVLLPIDIDVFISMGK